MSSRAPRNQLEQGQDEGPDVLHKSTIPWGQGVLPLICLKSVVWNATRSFSPGPCLDGIDSKEIIIASSLARRTYTMCMLRYV